MTLIGGAVQETLAHGPKVGKILGHSTCNQSNAAACTQQNAARSTQCFACVCPSKLYTTPTLGIAGKEKELETRV